MVDNNVSETFNGYIVCARSKHIIHMIEDIRGALRERETGGICEVGDDKESDGQNLP